MRARAVASGVLLAGALSWLAHAAVLTPRRLTVPDVPLAVPGWPPALDGLRIAVVGDVHAGAPWVGLDRVRQLTRAVVAARPDLVVLLGDHVADVRGGTHLAPEAVAEALSGVLDAGAPVVGVLGNHDWYAGGERVRAAFEAAGMPVLEESAVPVLDGRLWIAGVGDLWERHPSVEQALSQVPADAPVLLLTHNPDVVLDVPPRVPLVLAGHTHGGQVRLFGRGVHSVSKLTGNRFSAAGWHARQRLYVTAGVGTSELPLRTVTPSVPILVVGAA